MHIFHLSNTDIMFYYIQGMKYMKILIKCNAYFKKAIFHIHENIKSISHQ